MTSVLCCEQLGYGVRLAERLCRDKDTLIAEVHGQTYVATIRKEIGPARRWAYSCEARKVSYPPVFGAVVPPVEFGDRTEFSGRLEVFGSTGVSKRSVPGTSPVLCSGVSGGRPCDRKTGPPMPLAGPVVKVLAAMTEVATTIKPLVIKPMELSFIWSS
jgi:hypothetical protein